MNPTETAALLINYARMNIDFPFGTVVNVGDVEPFIEFRMVISIKGNIETIFNYTVYLDDLTEEDFQDVMLDIKQNIDLFLSKQNIRIR